MKIIIKSESGKTYQIKREVIELLSGLGFFLAFILLLSWVQNLAIAWGVETW